MKLFKLIANCVIAVLLVLSITLNIFILSVLGIKDAESFKRLLLAEELLESLDSTDVSIDDTVKDTSVEKAPEQIDLNIEIVPTPEKPIEEKPEDTETEEVEMFEKVVYQDDNIKVTYINFEDSFFGPEYKFEIENTGAASLTVLFTDVYIDGYQVFISGLTCEKLLPEKKSISDFILLTSEWEQFTDSPSEISFIIRVVNPKTYLTCYESERITFKA